MKKNYGITLAMGIIFIIIGFLNLIVFLINVDDFDPYNIFMHTMINILLLPLVIIYLVKERKKNIVPLIISSIHLLLIILILAINRIFLVNYYEDIRPYGHELIIMYLLIYLMMLTIYYFADLYIYELTHNKRWYVVIAMLFMLLTLLPVTLLSIDSYVDFIYGSSFYEDFLYYFYLIPGIVTPVFLIIYGIDKVISISKVNSNNHLNSYDEFIDKINDKMGD